MATGYTDQINSQNENLGNFIISPNRKFLAYRSSIFDAEVNDLIVEEELIIASAEGEQIQAIPWEVDWVAVPGWLDNQRLIISLAGLDPANQKATTMLVFNPFTGERQFLRPDFPLILNSPSTILPWWDGWQGVVYDPTLSLAVYPRYIGDEEEMFTYALWDLSNQQLVTTLENIFASFSLYNDIFPIPRWSPDGSQFIFRANYISLDSGTDDFELYSVSRDGKIKRMTNLDPFAGILDQNYSWSPDGRYIAMFLVTSDVGYPKALLAVLDTTTLVITDYCMPISYGGEGYGMGNQPQSPIWSPDSTQLLVVDWYQKDHRRVILVDIAQESSAIIAEDMEPVGWMVTP